MHVHSLQLTAGVGAPRMARAWVNDVLRTIGSPDRPWPDDAVYDLVLCASELVTLSLISRSAAMTLRLQVDCGVIRLSLIDDCPILTDSQDSAFHAQTLGLQVIEGCSQTSGVTTAGRCRELWAQFGAVEADAAARAELDYLNR